MSKLPFVWELNNKGIISHAIGTYHWIPDLFREDVKKYVHNKSCVMVECRDDPDYFFFKHVRENGLEEHIADQIKKDPANRELYQARAREFAECAGGLDFDVEDVARSLSIPVIGLETKEEHALYYAIGEKYNVMGTMNRGEPSTGPPENFVFGDEETAKKNCAEDILHWKSIMSKEDLETLMRRNPNMVERSMQHIIRAPSLIAVGTAHYFANPTLLALYEREGIDVKRIT